MNPTKEDEYIDFGIAPYCMGRLLLALHDCGIRGFFITLEDDDLHVRISKSNLDEAVYRIRKNGRGAYTTSAGKGKNENG